MHGRFAVPLVAVGLSSFVGATDAFAWVALTEPVHRTLVFFHIFGAILFMGNIIVTAMWMAQARRTQNAHVLHFASQSVMRADTIFTIPGILLILIPGLLTVGPWGGIPGASWAELGLAFFLLSGLIWLVMLLRLQKRMVRLSGQAVESNAALDESFHRTLGQWMMWGGIATLLPLASLYLMVYKPKLWG
jgi:uncharacterized membrane protein